MHAILTKLKTIYQKVVLLVKKLLRYLLTLATVAAVVTVTILASFFFTVTEKSITESVEDFARDAFKVEVVWKGKINFSRFPHFIVNLPALEFKDPSTQNIVGNVQGVEARIAHWPLALGAVRLHYVTIKNLTTTIHIPELTPQSLFAGTFAAIHFPNALRVKNATFSDTTLNIQTDKGTLGTIENATLKLGALSPEMQTTYEVQSKVTLPSLHFVNTFSSSGTLDVSIEKKRVMFDDVTLKSTGRHAKANYSFVVSADRIKVLDNELSGLNVRTMLTHPDHTLPDLRVNAVDFRYDGASFVSPELKVNYFEFKDEKSINCDTAAAVQWDLAQHKASLERINAFILLKSVAGLPDDFTTKITGSAKVDLVAGNAALSLAGDVMKFPFSYEGTLDVAKRPRLEGAWAFSNIDFNSLPALTTLPWLKEIFFNGSFSVENVKVGNLAGTQLRSNLTIEEGLASLKNAVMTLADGRIKGTAQLTESCEWALQTQLDAVDVKKLFDPTPVRGQASGTLDLSGIGLNPKELNGTSTLHLVHAGFKGVDANTVREYVLTGNNQLKPLNDTSLVAFDDVSLTLQFKQENLTLKNFIAHSIENRTTGEMQANLVTKELTGDLQTIFSPTSSTPTVYLKMKVVGTLADPTLDFSWDEARETVARVEDTPESATVTQPTKPKNSLWQSVKEFFKFH